VEPSICGLGQAPCLAHCTLVVPIPKDSRRRSTSAQSMHSTTEELDEDTIGSQARATSWRKFAVEANGGAPPPGYYQNLLNKSHDGMVDVTSESSRVAKQVEKDLKRTFGIESLRGLRIPTAEAQKSLRNVLLACVCALTSPSSLAPTYMRRHTTACSLPQSRSTTRRSAIVSP